MVPLLNIWGFTRPGFAPGHLLLQQPARCPVITPARLSRRKEQQQQQQQGHGLLMSAVQQQTSAQSAVACRSSSSSVSRSVTTETPQQAVVPAQSSSTYSSSSSTSTSSTTSSTSTGTGTDSSSSSSSSRRGLLLRSSLLPPLLLVGSDDATTIVNSILSGYGLPTLKPSQGFKPYDEFEDDYTFEHPRSWVARRNSLRPGVYIADFQTADKVAVEVLEPPADGDIRTAAVAAAVIPPGRQEDATLNLPAQRLIKSAPATLDGQEYLYLEFPSETTTRSGYNIKRRNFVVAGLRKDKLYVLSASARSDQYNQEKKKMLQHIVQSFRLR